MNAETAWWAHQRRLVERTLVQFDRGEISLKTAADDLMSISYAFAEQGAETMGGLASQLQKSPAEWLEEFQSAAFGIEVIFSVAQDRGWETLPAEEVAALDDEIDRVRELVSMLPR